MNNIMKLADAYAAAPQYLPLSDTTTNRLVTRAQLRAALFEALAQPAQPTWICTGEGLKNISLRSDAMHKLMECKARAAQPAQTDRPATDEFYKFWESKPELSKQQALGQFYAEAQPAREPLTPEQITTIAHRKASKYTHRSDPESHAYGFVKYTLIDFVRAIEQEHGIGGDK